MEFGFNRTLLLSEGRVDGVEAVPQGRRRQSRSMDQRSTTTRRPTVRLPRREMSSGARYWLLARCQLDLAKLVHLHRSLDLRTETVDIHSY